MMLPKLRIHLTRETGSDRICIPLPTSPTIKTEPAHEARVHESKAAALDREEHSAPPLRFAVPLPADLMELCAVRDKSIRRAGFTLQYLAATHVICATRGLGPEERHDPHGMGYERFDFTLSDDRTQIQSIRWERTSIGDREIRPESSNHAPAITKRLQDAKFLEPRLLDMIEAAAGGDVDAPASGQALDALQYLEFLPLVEYSASPEEEIRVRLNDIFLCVPASQDRVGGMHAEGDRSSLMIVARSTHRDGSQTFSFAHVNRGADLQKLESDFFRKLPVDARSELTLATGDRVIPPGVLQLARDAAQRGGATIQGAAGLAERGNFVIAINDRGQIFYGPPDQRANREI